MRRTQPAGIAQSNKTVWRTRNAHPMFIQERRTWSAPPLTPAQDRSLLRVAELQQLLAEVCAREQQDDGLGRVLGTVLQFALVFYFAFGEPLRHFADRLGIARRKMKYQEAFHPRAEQ